jgi:hypothetical protein
MSQSVESQGFETHPKTIPKPPQRLPPKAQTVENQALEKFFGVLGFAPKRYLSSAAPAPPVGTIFARKTLSNSIYLCHTPKNPIKTTKPLKIKDLSFWGSLWGCFGVALGWLDLLQKNRL